MDKTLAEILRHCNQNFCIQSFNYPTPGESLQNSGVCQGYGESFWPSDFKNLFFLRNIKKMAFSWLCTYIFPRFCEKPAILALQEKKFDLAGFAI